MRIWAIYLLFFLLVGSAQAEPSDRTLRFNEATTALSDGNYQGAIDDYAALSKEGDIAVAVYYNSGLAFKALKNPAEAALNLQRALILDPKLHAAQSALEELIHSGAIAPMSITWKQKLSRTISPRLGMVAGSLMFWVGLLLVWGRLVRKRKLGMNGYASLALLLVGGVLTVLFYLSDPFLLNNRTVMVISPDAIVMHETPSDNAKAVSRLMPGSTLQVLGSSAGWSYVQSTDKVVGWIPSEKAVRLIPEPH